MKINLKSHPKSSQVKVEKISDTSYEVWVREPADKGRANEAIIELLSTHFKIPKSQITLVRGHQSKNKIIDLPL